MILIDSQLKELCVSLKLIQPYDESLINPSSIDLRLGSKILLDTPEGFKEYDISPHTKENPFKLQPLDFCLAHTLETIKVPNNHTTWLHLKSSRAREGLSHALAGWIENGYKGVVTLELFNMRKNNTIDLYQGLKICQLIVSKTESPDKGYNGKYQGAKTVESSKDI